MSNRNFFILLGAIFATIFMFLVPMATIVAYISGDPLGKIAGTIMCIGEFIYVVATIYEDNKDKVH